MKSHWMQFLRLDTFAIVLLIVYQSVETRRHPRQSGAHGTSSTFNLKRGLRNFCKFHLCKNLIGHVHVDALDMLRRNSLLFRIIL